MFYYKITFLRKDIRWYFYTKIGIKRGNSYRKKWKVSIRREQINKKSTQKFKLCVLTLTEVFLNMKNTVKMMPCGHHFFSKNFPFLFLFLCYLYWYFLFSRWSHMIFLKFDSLCYWIFNKQNFTWQRVLTGTHVCILAYDLATQCPSRRASMRRHTIVVCNGDSGSQSLPHSRPQSRGPTLSSASSETDSGNLGCTLPEMSWSRSSLQDELLQSVRLPILKIVWSMIYIFI